MECAFYFIPGGRHMECAYYFDFCRLCLKRNWTFLSMTAFATFLLVAPPLGT